MLSITNRGNTVKQKILNTITDRIQYVQLKPGESINENIIADELGVSRTPVREALLLLARERLVEIYPQRGTYVAKVDLNLVKEMIYLRLTLESKVLNELALKKASIFPHVEKTIYMQELAIKNSDTSEYMKYDYRFHKELFELAGHSEIWNAIERTLLHCTRFRMLGWRSSEEELKYTFKEHKSIIESIEKGKTEQLQKTLEVHHDCNLKRYADKIIKENEDYFINIDCI